MARSNNPLLKGMSGSIGELVFRQVNGQTVVSAKPGKQKFNPSPLQELHRKIFREAVIWAKEILRDPVRRSDYEHLATSGQKLNNVLLKIKQNELKREAGLL